MRIAIGVLAGCTLVACARGGTGHMGSGGDDDDDAPAATLTLDPPATELVIVNGVAAHASFTATLTEADGTRRDVTAQTTFGISGEFGTFAGNELTIGMAGRTHVFGDYADHIGTADITARVRSVRLDPALPPNTPALFSAADDPSRAPQIVYPPADTVMPRNLGDFEIHWTDNHSNSVFEVSLHTELSDVRIYVAGGNGLAAQGPGASWAAFRADEWLAAVGIQGAVTYQVRGVDAAAGTGPGAAPPRTVPLSNETMDGGLYYWAGASVSNVTGIFRHDMARPGQLAEEFLTTQQTGGRCVACHVLSRDGTRMAVTYGAESASRPATVVDVATRALAPETTQWNFATFTPDNAQLLTVEHGGLVVRDAATQAVLATMTTTPAGAWVTQPELSPDGKQLVYVRPALYGTDIEFKLGQIYVRSYDRAAHTFGAERVLVTDSHNNFFPSWSPDGAWIAFNRGDGDQTSYDENTSATWVIKADGSQPAIELANANLGPRLTNTAVKWAPFAQTLGDAGEPMFWLTMSSKRDFGVRLRNTGLPQRDVGGMRAQLWMTPFFPARAAQGNDPSVPAFRLPFQSLDSSNQTAQWTARVVTIL